MEQVSKYLHLESSKFNDLDAIISKLEDQDHISSIHSLFSKIHRDETNFTYRGTLFVELSGPYCDRARKVC